MKETIQSIMDTVDKKKVQSYCKKVLKKCSFKSVNDMHNLADLADWLYVYGYYDEILKIAELIKEIQFSGNYGLWDHIDSIYCMKVRILRERGEVQKVQEIIDFINQYRAPHLYENVAGWFNSSLEENIKMAREINHSKSEEYGWRIVKLDCALKYREAGQFPMTDEELEKNIAEQIEILSKVK